MNVRFHRYTSLSDYWLNEYEMTFHPKDDEWRYTLYEEMVTEENSEIVMVGKNDDVPFAYFRDQCKISNDGSAVKLGGKAVYGCPVVVSDTPGLSEVNVAGRIRFRTPWPYAGRMCIGTFVRSWCGAKHKSGNWYVPRSSTDLIAPQSLNGDYSFFASTGVDKYKGTGSAFSVSDGWVQFIDNGGDLGRHNEEYVYIPFTARVTKPGTCIFVSIHLLYNWCPGVLGSNTICWTLPSPIPLMMTKETGNTLSLPIRLPDNNEFTVNGKANSLTTSARTVLLDANGNYRTDSEAIQPLNDGNVSHEESYSATFNRSLFLEYPNSPSIYGVAQIWTYIPSSLALYKRLRMYNLDGLPAENGFELRLPEDSTTRPTAGTITYSVVKNTFRLSYYVQNRTGVKIKMAQPTCQLNATPKAMIVEYYGGTARIETQDSDGGFTFTLDRFTANGSQKFTVYAEDSRGFISSKASKTLTVYAYAPPEMTGCTLERVDSNGNPSDFGDCAALTVEASFSAVSTKNGIASIRAAILQYEPHMDWEHAVDYTVAAGTPYTFALTLDPAKIYRVRIKITDKGGVTTTYYRTVRSAVYTLHLRQGGNGVGMGEASRSERSLSVAENWAVVVYDRTLMDMLVPIGSVQLIDRQDGEVVDMTDLYPGTVWERITDRFFLGSGEHAPGDMGGSETVTLAAENIPQIPVTFANGIYGPRSRFAGPINAIPGVGGVTVPNEKGGFKQWSGPNFLNGSYANKGNEPKPVTTVPPYLAVDAWIRIG